MQEVDSLSEIKVPADNTPAVPPQPAPKKSFWKRFENQFKPLAIIFVILIIVLIILCGFSIYSKATNKNSELNQIPTHRHMTSYPTPSCKIDGLISFDVPQGWKKTTDCSETGSLGQIILLSQPDPKTTPTDNNNFTNGIMSITIETQPLQKNESLDTRYQFIYDQEHNPNPPSATPSALTKTVINGYPALSYVYDFEGHTLYYIVVVNGNIWEIYLGLSTAQESENKNLINQFLSSIKFTDQSLLKKLGDFPIYPNSKYLAYNPKIDCTGQTYQQGSNCTDDYYSFKTSDPFEKVQTWYIGKTIHGWKCGGGGGAVTTDTKGNPIAGSVVSGCSKNGIYYHLNFDGDAKGVSINVGIPIK